MGTTISKPVLVGSKAFFDSYDILLQENTEVIEIGNCLTIEFPGVENTDANGKAKITIHTNGSLNQRLSSLPFISALIKEGAVTLGNIIIPIHFEREKLEQIHYSEIELQIDSLHRVRRVLDKLHITKDLELDQCDNGDYWRLNAIIDAIENGATVFNMKEPPYFVSSIDIANIRIAMLCDKTNDGGYKLRDFFGTHVDIAFGYDEALQEPHVSSQYCILKKNDFLELDNIMFKAIVNDVININTSDKFHADQSNLMMLEMLSAYDENHNSELLDSAEDINDWLLSSAEESAKEIAFINRMQIILRRRPLTYTEKQDVAAIISDSDDPTIKAGAFIILGEKDEAGKILLSMDDNIRNQFMKYPIYHLYELLEDNHEDRNAENAQPE